MPSDLYSQYVVAAMTGGATVDLTTQVVQAYCIDAADYTVDLAVDEFLDDVAAGARVAGPITLTSKSFTTGTFDAADIVFPSVSGDEFEAVILVVAPTSGANDANTRLLYYQDTGTNLAFTPNGNNIDCTWSGSGIFTLGTSGPLYVPYLQAAMTGGTNVDVTAASRFRLIALNTSGTNSDAINFDTDDFLNDVDAGAREAGPITLTNVGFTGANLGADNAVFPSATGDVFEALLFVLEEASPAETTTRLVGALTSGTGLPFTPNGNNIDVTFNASGILTV